MAVQYDTSCDVPVRLGGNVVIQLKGRIKCEVKLLLDEGEVHNESEKEC